MFEDFLKILVFNTRLPIFHDKRNGHRIQQVSFFGVTCVPLLFLLSSKICFCFFSHKVYMKIQEVMMKQLGCLSSEQVTEDYPTMSLYKALTEYFIAFRVKCSGMDTLCLRLSPI